MPTYTTPGVYIVESPANGPIVGVGTSTTAFIGAALQGPLLQPTLITNWTQFVTLFGSYMNGPPGFYLAYAVKGFFDNGGTSAYIVRVGTAAAASLALSDRGTTTAGEALLVSAQQGGLAGNQITVAVTDAYIVPLTQDAVVTQFSAPITSASANNVELTNIADAASFSPGDIVTIETTTERATITRIVGATLYLQTALTTSYTTDTVRIADLQVGQTTFRVTNNAGLEPGSVIQLTQGTTDEYQVINTVSGSFVTVQAPGLAKTYSMDTTSAATKTAAPVTVQSLEFTMEIASPGNPSETWQDLSMDPRHSHYWGTVVQSAYVTVSPPATPSEQYPPLNRPADISATALEGGANDTPKAITSAEYDSALQALVPVQDVELVCVPDRTDELVQMAVVNHCETMMDRFAILQSTLGYSTTQVTTQRAWCQSSGLSPGGGGYAAFYYPWIQINDPSSLTGANTILVPPCGHLAGIYARNDSVGVQNAPANLTVTGSVGLEVNVDSVTQGVLNIAGINVIRIFPGQALPVVWGARTTAPSTSAWTYINVRRLFIYVETSLKYGLQPYVFQPNDTGLWKRLNRTITDFLTRVWQSGGLFGAKASEAFYVQIDEENNPPASQALGQVNITIGMAPVYPAEFVIVTIGMWDSGLSITEQ